jgi:excisionase family DNA binding protein
MNEEITFEKVPQAIAFLITEVQELKQTVLQAANNPNVKQELDRWMNLKELRDYLPDHPANPTIYGWVSKRLIPHHKGGKKLRFRKSEIDNWLSASKRQSNDEIETAAQEYLSKKTK